jgi:hypothetical protein
LAVASLMITLHPLEQDRFGLRCPFPIRERAAEARILFFF